MSSENIAKYILLGLFSVATVVYMVWALIEDQWEYATIPLITMCVLAVIIKWNNIKWDD